MPTSVTAPLTHTIARLAVSCDALTCVDLVRAADATYVDKHTLMTSDKAAASAAFKELDILLTLQPQTTAAAGDSHVVALRSFRLDNTTQRLHLLMEHCARGDLFHVAQEESRLLQAGLLLPYDGITTSEHALRRIAFQTLRGLRTLHTSNIAHMDVSLENVFLTTNGDVRLGDFALAQRFQRDEHGRVLRLGQTPHIAKPVYTAPEMFNSGDLLDDVTKADSWSLGVLLWHLLTRSPLFPTGAPTMEDPVYIAILQSTNWTERRLSDASHNLRNLLVGLLDPNPATRLSVETALQHAWFTGDKLKRPSPIQAPVILTVSQMSTSSSEKMLQEASITPASKHKGGSAKTRRGRRNRRSRMSSEISLDATRVTIAPSRLRQG